jgi:hypothetical protein
MKANTRPRKPDSEFSILVHSKLLIVTAVGEKQTPCHGAVRTERKSVRRKPFFLSSQQIVISNPQFPRVVGRETRGTIARHHHGTENNSGGFARVRVYMLTEQVRPAQHVIIQKQNYFATRGP